MSWAHKQDDEWNRYAADNAGGAAELVFGRVTYEMMAGFWPTPQAHQLAPAVAATMNAAKKVVFSRTLAAATWHNTRLEKGNLVEAVQALKAEPGPPLLIFGSGTLVAPLLNARLVDELELVVNSVILGPGRSMFAGADGRHGVTLTRTRAFGNGNVVLSYARS
jgi:dihydrofolate reductase